MSLRNTFRLSSLGRPDDAISGYRRVTSDIGKRWQHVAARFKGVQTAALWGLPQIFGFFYPLPPLSLSQFS